MYDPNSRTSIIPNRHCAGVDCEGITEMSDMERVELAMRKVWQHKVKKETLTNSEWLLLAEAATKMMWLIEEENERKNAL